MSVIVINSDSPSFVCSSPACYIDSESIDTSYVYDSGYASSCDTVGTIPYSVGGGTVGPAGPAGTDGRSIVSIVRTLGDGSPGTTDTYTITYNIAPLTTTFLVYNGDDGAAGAAGAQGIQGIQGVAGSNGTNGTNGYTILTGLVDPAVGVGVNGDLYLNSNSYQLFKKVAGTWTNLITTLKGADGAAGAAGTDGYDGDVWTYGSGAPVDITEETFNSYYVDTDTNDVWYKAASTASWGASPITNLNGDSYYTTSTTSITLSSLAIGDTVAITTASSNMSYSIGQFLVVANSTTDYFTCKVLSYSGTALSVEVIYIEQVTAGALAMWYINLAGITESNALPDWYTITATAGTGALTTRTFTGPSGWTIGAANVVSIDGLPVGTAYDLNIEHNTDRYGVETIVYVTDGTYNTKVTGSKAYGTMYENITHTGIQLASLCTEAKALTIHIRLL